MEEHNKLKQHTKIEGILRDPVHGDILLTKVEFQIISTLPFQRLNRIKQLGFAHMLYPGAIHTRFIHSLGTLKATHDILTNIRDNDFDLIQIDPYHVIIARLSSLLHDLAHIPFGHTLEDEGNLFPPEWKDNDRTQYYLGLESDIGKIIVDNFGEQCLADVVKIVTVKDDFDLSKLEYPFIADIIGDTVCADLIDYSQRDCYFAGLAFSIPMTLWRRLTIRNIDGKFHTVLRISDKNGKVEMNYVNEIINLLHVRFLLAERVNLHKTKIAASAMIIDAVYDSLKYKKIKKQDLFDLGDDELLNALSEKGTPTSRRIVEKLMRRMLFKPVYSFQFHDRYQDETMKERKKKIFAKYNTPEIRWNLERKLEKINNLKPGSIIIYCPIIKDSKKSSKLKVLIGNEIFPLDKIPIEDVKKTIESIEKKFEYLPRLCVYLDYSIYNEDKKKQVAATCIDFFQNY